MSQITCCPSCGTQFRVVADQLRISDGWVRCGRCQQVFDAHQNLQDLQRLSVTDPDHTVQDASAGAVSSTAASDPSGTLPTKLPSETATAVESPPAPMVPQVIEHMVQAAPTPPPEITAADAQEVQEPRWDHDHDTQLSDASDEEAVGMTSVLPELDHVPAKLDPPLSADAMAPPELSSGMAVALESKPAIAADPMMDAHSEPSLEIDTAPQASPSNQQPTLEPASTDRTTSVDAAVAPATTTESETEIEPELAALQQALLMPKDGMLAAEPMPSFVRQAQRKAWWSQPWVRFIMGMLVMLLPLALLLQVALHERNALAARWPYWEPMLQAMCVALRCEVAPYQNIHAVVVSGSAFAQEPQSNHYRLELSIRNQADFAVATPAVELSLTDAHDQVLVRKVLHPQDIGAPQELAAHTEWSDTVPLATEGLNLPVLGYRVLLFYP